VLAPGAAPLRALRYSIPAGHKGGMDLTMALSIAMNVGGMALPMDMPPMKIGIDIAVTGVAPNGDISYDVAFTSVTVESTPGANPAAVQAMQAALAGMTTIKGAATVSNRGITKSARLDVGDPALKQILGQMASTIENLSNPFPEEAIGVGARWEVRQAMAAAGQTSFLRSEYEVVSVSGSTVSLKVKADHTAPPQSVVNPDLPAGSEMRLDKMAGSGAGTIVIQLDSMVPTSEMSSTTLAEMTMSMGGQTQAISAESKIKISVAPRKDK